MAARKVLRAFVHVVGADGSSVALAAGSTIPEEYVDQVTNPAAFVEVEDDAEVQAAVPVTPSVTPDVTPAVTETPVEPTPVVEPWEVPPAEPTAVVEATPEATPVVEATPEPVEDVVYTDLSFADLQKLAKSRDLSGQGNTETLIARLEADDRDK